MKCLDPKECTYCGAKFTPRVLMATLCSKRCMYEWRKQQNWTTKTCLHCSSEFNVRKKDASKRVFCSPECHKVSDYKRQKISEWSIKRDNPFKDPNKQTQFRQTKLEKYGTLHANPEKRKQTCLERYGTTAPQLLHPSNGKRISNVQKRYYEYIKERFSDATIEHHLKDVDIHVDIYIPSENKVIEIYGDYWHCNPATFEADYYHSQLHMTSEEKWQKDQERIKRLEDAGYQVEILWEKVIRGSEFFRGNHTIYNSTNVLNNKQNEQQHKT